MSGPVKTVPYKDVISRIEENGGFVIDKVHARLDQTDGVAKAYERGYKNVAVTVAIPTEAKKIRSLYPNTIIFGVHVTGLNREDTEILVSAVTLLLHVHPRLSGRLQAGTHCYRQELPFRSLLSQLRQKT